MLVLYVLLVTNPVEGLPCRHIVSTQCEGHQAYVRILKLHPLMHLILYYSIIVHVLHYTLLLG